MKHETVRASAFAMPLTNPAFPPGPYRFVSWEPGTSQVLGRLTWMTVGVRLAGLSAAGPGIWCIHAHLDAIKHALIPTSQAGDDAGRSGRAGRPNWRWACVERWLSSGCC